MRHIWLLACAVVLATATSAAAQWLKLPTPGIPRLADGKPNLDGARAAHGGRQARLLGSVEKRRR